MVRMARRGVVAGRNDLFSILNPTQIVTRQSTLGGKVQAQDKSAPTDQLCAESSFMIMKLSSVVHNSPLRHFRPFGRRALKVEETL